MLARSPGQSIRLFPLGRTLLVGVFLLGGVARAFGQEQASGNEAGELELIFSEEEQKAPSEPSAGEPEPSGRVSEAPQSIGTSAASPQATLAPRTDITGASAAPPIDRHVIEEVLVTANRRTQNVQDIAGGIRVFAGEALEKAGTRGFEDYVFQIPGADIVDDGVNKKLALRGVSNMAPAYGGGGTTSPIGLYLNDTPIQGSGDLPDLDLYDLERIEVLKGPQGTLYGEGAQGGAFRMLLNRAVPNELSAKGEVGIGRTLNGSGFDHPQKAMLNLPLLRSAPLLGSWATRLVATRRVDQGFVDYFNRGTRGENDATNLMARIHLDGEIGEALSVSGMVLHQRQRLDQIPTVQLDQGDLRNERLEPQFADADFTLASLTLDVDLGFATATSSTSGFLNDRDTLLRTPIVATITFALTNPLTGLLPLAPPAAELEQEWVEVESRQFGIAQELRLVSNGDSWLDWTAGAFYRKRSNDGGQFFTNNESNDPPPVGPGLLEGIFVERFEQMALFGEATLELPWRLELTLGLRGFREKVGLEGTFRYGGALYPLALASAQPDGTYPEQTFGITTTALTPKASLSWFADDWRMLYATVAEGVRSGGNNVSAITNTIPAQFEPDTLSSYELGAKTQWLDGRLTANLAAFYNDWRDLQMNTLLDSTLRPQEVVPVSQFAILNVARAISRGVELELTALQHEDFLLGFNLFVGDGEIVEGDPSGNIADHTPIPQLAELSYSALASYTANRWPIFGFTPSLQLGTQSTGERTPFPAASGIDAAELAGFQIFNGQVGLTSERWDVSFAVRNVTDARAELGAGILENDTLTIGRPRTWVTRLAFRW